MDWTIDNYTAHALLTQFSEWLDVENIQIRSDDDGRTHEALVQNFIAFRNPSARPKVLAPQ